MMTWGVTEAGWGKMKTALTICYGAESALLSLIRCYICEIGGTMCFAMWDLVEVSVWRGQTEAMKKSTCKTCLVPLYALSCYLHTCGLPVGLSDPCPVSSEPSLSGVFGVGPAVGCVCFVHCSIHSPLNSRPWLCGAQNSHEDSCLCRCWNWHYLPPAITLCSKSKSWVLPIQVQSNSNRISSRDLRGFCESRLHYSPSGEAWFCINGRHA